MRLRLLSLASLAVLATIIAGCGGRSKAVTVTGIVTLDDVPVEGVSVRFIPVDPSKGEHAFGTTGSDGRYRLTTKNPEDGAIPGDYKVVVTMAESRDAPEGMAAGSGGAPRPGEMTGPMKSFSGEQQRKQGGSGGATKKAPTKIPAVYNEFKTTPLTATVPAGGDINLPLHSKGG